MSGKSTAGKFVLGCGGLLFVFALLDTLFCGFHVFIDPRGAISRSEAMPGFLAGMVFMFFGFIAIIAGFFIGNKPAGAPAAGGYAPQQGMQPPPFGGPAPGAPQMGGPPGMQGGPPMGGPGPGMPGAPQMGGAAPAMQGAPPMGGPAPAMQGAPPMGGPGVPGAPPMGGPAPAMPGAPPAAAPQAPAAPGGPPQPGAPQPATMLMEQWSNEKKS